MKNKPLILFLFFTISFFAQKKNVVVTYKVAYHEDELLAENCDQRCRKIACRQKTELSKEIEETVSILT
jgi:hypothetical protein